VSIDIAYNVVEKVTKSTLILQIRARPTTCSSDWLNLGRDDVTADVTAGQPITGRSVADRICTVDRPLLYQ